MAHKNSREWYLSNAQKVLDEAQRRHDEGIHLCVECKHYGDIDILGERSCKHPIVILAQRNILDCDTDKRRMGRITYQRSSRGSSKYDPGPVVCGPNGELFEPKETNSLWSKFWSWLKH